MLSVPQCTWHSPYIQTKWYSSCIGCKFIDGNTGLTWRKMFFLEICKTDALNASILSFAKFTKWWFWLRSKRFVEGIVWNILTALRGPWHTAHLPYEARGTLIWIYFWKQVAQGSSIPGANEWTGVDGTRWTSFCCHSQFCISAAST